MIISVPESLSASSEHKLLHPVELINNQSEELSEGLHADIAKMSKMIRDWEVQKNNSVYDTVITFVDSKD